MNTVHVLYPEKTGIISRNIYGYFVEQIGALIEGGVWVGEDSPIPNIRGIRKELVEKFRAVRPSVLRWPGGCTAEVYDWRDGIGPRDKRPVSLSVEYRADGKVQRNDFGTHEFVDFCRLVGAEPYICLNVAGAAPLDSFRWMEYCNMPRGTTTLSRLREENGSPEPFDIKYWGLGNENGNHGGMMTPEEYCAAYCRVVSISWSILENRETIASGPIWNNIDWTRRFFESYESRAKGWEGKKLDGYSLHWYSGSDGNDDTFTEQEWYVKLANTAKTQTLIENQRDIVREFDPESHVGLIVDEWGSWTSAKRVPSFDKPLYLQIGTMREALVAAMSLSIFNNNCDIVKMANITALINYIHSLFMSDGEKFIVTPTYHVFDMMKDHQDAECVRTVCASEKRSGIEGVTASASVKDGKSLVTLVNTSYSEPAEVAVELRGGIFPGSAEVVTLAAADPHAHNTYGEPEAVVPSRAVVKAAGNRLRLTLPAASVVCVSY